jgi:tRNA nucleotidyltransferase/poly(A) polymerase
MLRDALVAQFPKLVHLPSGSIAVGGAVRDLILGVEPLDVDVECDEPLACASALGKVITLGRGDLAVYRVVVDGRVYDFSRRTDLGRRDFTINAIAVDLGSGELRDPHKGQADIARRVVRMIVPQNFDDDPLRMLRGVRLAVRFDFTIDDVTVAAIRRRAARIRTVAAERVTYELHAIFSANRFRKALQLLNATALDEPLFGYSVDPNRFPAGDVSLAAAYALLLRNPKEFAKRWKWSDALLRDVVTLQGLMRDPNKVALYEAGERLARQLPIAPPELPDFTIKPLLDGNEIAALLHREPGPEIGARKRALLAAQVRGDVRTRAEAEKLVQSFAPRSGEKVPRSGG